MTAVRLISASVLLALAAAAEPVPEWGVFEDFRTADQVYDNALQDLTVEVAFTSPGGETTTVPAFWDGDRNWRARFSPTRPGRWTYRWSASDRESGLDGLTGSFDCVAYGGDNPLYTHGAVAPAPEGRHFAHADGTPFLWLGDTAWNGVLLADEDEWESYLSTRAEQSFSVVQFVALPWRSASGNADGRPAFYGRETIALDAVFFQRMDERVAAINRRGMLAAMVMFWTHSRHTDLNPGMFLPEDQLILLGRYLVARYGAYHITWFLGGDGSYGGERAERWKRVGRALFGDGAPGIRRPVTMHSTYWNADAFGGEDWWDYNGYQSGHNRVRGLERVTQGEPTEFWKNDRRPVLNLEPNYEAHRNREQGAPPDDVFTAFDTRRQSWYSVLNAPIAGVSYGAHGVWAWHPSPQEPMTHEYTGIGPAWFDAVHLPGAGHLGVQVDILRSLDWTALRPAQDLLTAQPGANDATKWVSVASGGGATLAYTPGEAFELRGLSGDAQWISPRSGEEFAAGAGPRFDPPSAEDWVLVVR